MHDVTALGTFFNPRSVAVVGASSDPRKPGNIALRNMRSMGYRGGMFPVNPREEAILGLPCYRSVLDIPQPVDLAILLVAADHTLEAAKELAHRRRRANDVSAAVCMSAGFAELNTAEAGARERELVRTLRDASIRLIGPNCLGVIDTSSGFNTNFDIPVYPRGGTSVLTQSGAFGNSLLLGSGTKGRLRLNKYVSIGNMADVQMSELLAYLKDDDSTRTIGIYLEGLSDPREFFEVAGEVATVKPIVILKSGRSEMGSTAALSHTGSVAGADAIYDGACRQAGLFRARTVAEFYDTLRAFSKQPVPAGKRVCVLTHMGGPGTMCIDEISTLPGIEMAQLSPGTVAALRTILSPAANIGHPAGYIDLTAAHWEALHNQVLQILFRDPGVDAVIQILAPSAFLDQELLAREIVSAWESQAGAKKPLLHVVTFGDFAGGLRDRLEEAGLPTFDYPDSVARVAASLAAYGCAGRVAAARAGDAKACACPSPPAQGPAATLIAGAAAQRRVSLLEPEAYEVCGQYGIRVAPFRTVESLEGALRAAGQIGYPVVLKVVSAEILHKTEAGGVMLGITSDEGLRHSYGRLIDNARRAAPQVDRPGVLVQKMMPASTELVLGGLRDRLFGPAVMFGLGGIYVEVLKRVNFRLAPLSLADAKTLVRETLPAALLEGVRGRKPMNVDAIAAALVSLGRLFEEQPLVEQVDLNPFVPDDEGGLALDARIILAKQAGST
ncbi:MAG: acetate--CoA ligase family protein [Burkholderiales bacterium]|nr:acetate--CoA ligase family protein [Burkholderiales bacterium]